MCQSKGDRMTDDYGARYMVNKRDRSDYRNEGSAVCLWGLCENIHVSVSTLTLAQKTPTASLL